METILGENELNKTIVKMQGRFLLLRHESQKLPCTTVIVLTNDEILNLIEFLKTNKLC